MEILSQNTDAFCIFDVDDVTSPVVFASPHSGRRYAPEFLKMSVLDAKAIRSSEDAYVDQLIDFVPQLGCPLLVAKAPRAYVDLNRAPYELDPALIENVRMRSQNPRVASGLGVIPRVVANAREIYRGKISRPEADRRIQTVWKPYHEALKKLLDRAKARFGYALLVDVHSMPHEAVAYLSKPHAGAQIVLGDRFGASADAEISDVFEFALRQEEFIVNRNTPFAGAFIAQEYGQPILGYHALQLEIDRSLYLKANGIVLRDDVEAFKQRLRSVFAEVVEHFGPTRVHHLAAE